MLLLQAGNPVVNGVSAVGALLVLAVGATWLGLALWLLIRSIRRSHPGIAMLALLLLVLPIGLLVPVMVFHASPQTAYTVSSPDRMSATIDSSSRLRSPPGATQIQVDRSGVQISDGSGHNLSVRSGSGSMSGAWTSPDDVTAPTSPPRAVSEPPVPEPPASELSVPEPPDPVIAEQAPPASLECASQEFGEFEADVYPSVQTAVITTLRSMLRPMGTLDKLIPDDVRLARIELRGNIDADTLNAGARKIEPEFRPASVEVVTTSSTPDTREVDKATLVIRVEKTGEGRVNGQVSKSFAIRLTGSNGREARYAHVLEKTWVEDLGRFQATSYPGRPRNLIVAWTDREATDERSARERAVETAVAALMPYVRRHIDFEDPSLRKFGSPDELIRTWLKEDLRRNRCQIVADRFAQKIERPYGTIYRQALLLDASDENLARIVPEYAQGLQARRWNILRTLVSAAGLVVLICVIYLFLNAATKGYYAWSLRAAGVVAVVAGIFLVLRLA